jgi:hypothetical protein
VRAVIVSLVLALLISPAMPLPAASGCESAAEKAKHKPSSFAPRPKAAHNSYGAPVGSKILTKHPPKKKPASA